jgi:hypothetical protein
MWKTILVIILALLPGVIAGQTSGTDPDSARREAEALDLIAKARANWPASRDARGTSVNTVGGRQLVPGSMPSEVSINQQIFNDIDRLREKMLNFMVDVTNMGTKYNLSPDFDLVKVRLQESMTQLENAMKLKLRR